MSLTSYSPGKPPGGLLPAQLGMILVRRPTVGHAAATLVGLAERGLLTVTEPGGTGTAGSGTAQDTGAARWLIGSSASAAPHSRIPLTRFEAALLDGLPPATESLSLTEDAAEKIAPVLRGFAGELVKDAVHRGWLRRMHRDRLTSDGDELLADTRKFRAALRRASIAGHHEVLAAHLPYALAFGLVTPASAPASALPLACFSAAFISVCSALPDWRHAEPRQERPDVGAPDFDRDEWRGMIPGGRFIASHDSATPNLPWP